MQEQERLRKERFKDLAHPRTKKPQIFGIHNLQQDCDDPPGWATQIASMFTLNNPTARYEYDFGDDWQHTVTLITGMALWNEFQDLGFGGSYSTMQTYLY